MAVPRLAACSLAASRFACGLEVFESFLALARGLAARVSAARDLAAGDLAVRFFALAAGLVFGLTRAGFDLAAAGLDFGGARFALRGAAFALAAAFPAFALAGAFAFAALRDGAVFAAALPRLVVLVMILACFLCRKLAPIADAARIRIPRAVLATGLATIQRCSFERAAERKSARWGRRARSWPRTRARRVAILVHLLRQAPPSAKVASPRSSAMNSTLDLLAIQVAVEVEQIGLEHRLAVAKGRARPDVASGGIAAALVTRRAWHRCRGAHVLAFGRAEG